MGIRTGRQYLDKLNSMHPHVVIDGVAVTENIAEHPAFRNVARTYAQLYDMQFSGEDVMPSSNGEVTLTANLEGIA